MGESAWVALEVESIELGNGLVLEGIDAHITLFYAQRPVMDSLDQVLLACNRALASFQKKERQHFTGRAKFCAEHAHTDYAWADISVHLPLHAACHAVANSRMQEYRNRVRDSKWHFSYKAAFHLSFRTWTASGDPERAP